MILDHPAVIISSCQISDVLDLVFTNALTIFASISYFCKDLLHHFRIITEEVSIVCSEITISRHYKQVRTHFGDALDDRCKEHHLRSQDDSRILKLRLFSLPAKTAAPRTPSLSKQTSPIIKPLH